MGGDDWLLLCTGFNVTLYGPPTAGPTANTDGAHQNHVIMEVKVIQQLVLTITGLVAIGAQSGRHWWIKHPALS